MHTLFRLLHFIGLFGWFGGAIVIGLLAAQAKEPEIVRNLRALLQRVVSPMMTLAWIGALGMLIPRFSDVYAKAGWMHSKILVALIASALTGIMGAKMKRFAAGDDVDLGKVRLFGLLVFVGAILNTVLAVLKPF